MAIRVALSHRTTYRFDRHVAIAPHEIRLRPAPHCRTPILGYSLNVAPEPHFLNWQQDPYGNWVARLVFPERADAIEIEVDLVADLTVINPVRLLRRAVCRDVSVHLCAGAGEGADSVPRDRAARAAPDRVARRSSARRSAGREPGAVAGAAQPAAAAADPLPGAHAAGRADARGNARATPAARAATRAGCWCRSCGIWASPRASRRVTSSSWWPTSRRSTAPRAPTADFTDLHAWAEAFIPGAGWIGFDPTSGLLAGEGHIPLACTADPGNAAPVIGYTDVADVEFDFTMSVTRIHEDPRVTLPYTRRAMAGDRRARRAGRRAISSRTTSA